MRLTNELSFPTPFIPKYVKMSALLKKSVQKVSSWQLYKSILYGWFFALQPKFGIDEHIDEHATIILPIIPRVRIGYKQFLHRRKFFLALATKLHFGIISHAENYFQCQ